MTLSGLNFVGIIVATAVSFISGGIWFGPKTFYPVWMKARGIQSGILTENQNKPALLFGGTFLGTLIMTMTVGVVVTSLQKYQPNIGILDGAAIGLLLGVGIGSFASLSHRLFGGDGLKVWVIETANDAMNMAIAGAIIAFFN